MTHRYRIRRAFGGRYPVIPRCGQLCRVICAGRGNVLIEFADGLRVVTSRWAVRRVTP